MTDPAPLAYPGIGCFRCAEPGHFADSPDCPWLIKAATKRDHLDRIDQLIQRWMNGDITDYQKRQLIRDENKLHYGNDCKPALKS